MLFKAEIKGLKEAVEIFNQLPMKIGNEVDKELTKTAEGIAMTAKMYVPSGLTGDLGRSISADVGTKYRKAVRVAAPYAAYVEFGTGSKVFQGNFHFTGEMKKYAKKFYVNGKGKLPAQPFLFPAYQTWMRTLAKSLKIKLTTMFSVSRDVNSGRGI